MSETVLHRFGRPNRNRPNVWTAERRQLLERLLDDCRPYPEIAAQLDTTVAAIMAAMNQMRVPGLRLRHLSISGVTDIMGCSRIAVERWIAECGLRSMVDGQLRLIRRQDLVELIQDPEHWQRLQVTTTTAH